MSGSVQKLDLELADLDRIARLDLDQVGIRQARDLLDAVGLVLVHIDFRLDLFEHLGGALDILAHHAPAQMIRVIVRQQQLVDLVAFRLGVFADRVDVPRGIDDRHLLA